MASAMRSSILRQALMASRQTTVPQKMQSVSALSRPASLSVTKAAGFHASQTRALLPPLPQVIKGTVNDANPVPPSSPMHGSTHWTFERLIAVGLIPLTIAPFASGSLSPLLDGVFCAAILAHSHIGFQSVIIDYIPTARLPKTRKLFWWGLNLATVVVGVGLYEFETNDVGLTGAVARIWAA